VKLYRMSANVCNRGTAPLPAGMPSTFYVGDPRMPGSMKVCTTTLKSTVAVGTCQGIVCEWDNPSPGPYDLWLRVDDDGTGGRPFGQCKNDNDLAHFPNAGCGNIPG
jgi:hypothetical protein